MFHVTVDLYNVHSPLTNNDQSLGLSPTFQVNIYAVSTLLTVAIQHEMPVTVYFSLQYSDILS